jgi:DNA mismatch endonuclease (patch repair protein)
MALIRGKDTKPEMVVRRLIHELGYRFRLHRRDLPGHPDLVLPRHRAVIFVHGCFWHRHDCPKGRREPKTNRLYWNAKLRGNADRDAKCLSLLEAAGWRVLTIWECETAAHQELLDTMSAFLGASASEITLADTRRELRR